MSKADILRNTPVKSDDCVDFLIITALPEERDAVLGQLPDHQKVQKADFLTYYRATLETDSGSDQENPIVAMTMLTQMGNTSAAAHTTQCIQHLNPYYVLMVGIAGGIKNKVNLGDVVVSNKIIYYEHTKETPSGSEQRIEVESVDRLLLERAMNREINWYTLIQAERPTSPNIAEVPQVYFAPIASGEKVIADDDSVSKLTQLAPKIAAIEMESFGVAIAAAKSEHRPRFIAIRGISDYADDAKNDDWHEYAADSAASFALELLRSGAIPIRQDMPLQHLTHKTLVIIRHYSMESLSRAPIVESLPKTLRFAKLVEIEINQTDLYDNGRLTDPVAAAKRQRNIFRRFSSALNTYPDPTVCYHGIAHIPLLFHIGCQFLGRRSLLLFEHNRITDQWDPLLQKEEDYPQTTLEGLPDAVIQKSGDVVVRISISYPVTPEAIEDIVTNPIASLHLSIDQPKRDCVTSKDQLQRYSAEFRDMLDKIHEKFPNTECVHIFYAGPVALAVNFGRQIRKTIDPRIIVYNYSTKDNPPGYAWGLEVTADVDSHNFSVRVGD